MLTNNRRTAKEYKLDNDETGIKSKYGTLNKNNPEIIYIRSRATITPTVKKKDFSEEVELIKKTFVNSIKTTIADSLVFENKHICSIEMSENGISFGKKSHVKYDVFLKPKVIKSIEEYTSNIQYLVGVFNRNLYAMLSEVNIKVE